MLIDKFTFLNIFSDVRRRDKQDIDVSFPRYTKQWQKIIKKCPVFTN